MGVSGIVMITVGIALIVASRVPSWNTLAGFVISMAGWVGIWGAVEALTGPRPESKD